MAFTEDALSLIAPNWGHGHSTLLQLAMAMLDRLVRLLELLQYLVHLLDLLELFDHVVRLLELLDHLVRLLELVVSKLLAGRAYPLASKALA